MNDEQRQRQMDFLLGQQARHDTEIGQIRRLLISAIRIGNRERFQLRDNIKALIGAQTKSEDEFKAFQSETRENMNALISAQIKTEDGLKAIQTETRAFQTETRAFQAETRAFQTETRAFQAETHEAVALLRRSMSRTLDRVEALEDSKGNGGRPAN